MKKVLLAVVLVFGLLLSAYAATYTPVTYPKFRAYKPGTSTPLVGGQLYTYTPGTTVPVTTYKDVAGVSQNTNPIILDANGEAALWYNGYVKLVLYDSTGVVVWTQDNFPTSQITQSLAGDNTGDLSGYVNIIGSGTGSITGFSIPLYLTNYLSVNDALTAWVDVRAYGAVGDGVTADDESIQAAVVAAEALNTSYTLLIPHGYTFRITEPIRFTKGGVKITGGGKILCDSATWTDNLAIAGYSSNARAGFIFWNGVATSHYVSPSVPFDPAYDNTMLQNIVIDGVEFYDNFGYSDAYGQFSTALMFAWGNHISIRNCVFRNFKGEIILGILKNFRIQNNYFYDSAFQAISILDINGVTSNNTFYKVGEPYEGSLHNSSLVNNVMDNVGGGQGSAIIIGNSSIGYAVRGIIKGNTITNLNAYQAITVDLTTNNDLDSLIIDGNYIEGVVVGARQFIHSDSPSADNGSLVISNNTIIESASQSDDYIAGIQVEGDITGTKSNVKIVGNNLVFRTAKALGGIVATAYQKIFIFGNYITTNAALRIVGLGNYYYLGANGEYYLAAAGAESSFGANSDMFFGENYANFNLVKDDVIRIATTSDNVANTQGKPTILFANSGSINVSEFSNTNPGQIITVTTNADNVVLVHGTYINTTTDNDVTMTAYQTTQFLVYYVDGSPRHFRAVQLFAPVGL